MCESLLSMNIEEVVDLETRIGEESGAIENYDGGNLVVVPEGDGIVEPYEGMEFESENHVKAFYDEYARRLGFIMRVMKCRRSEVDGRILSRRLGCNKEGFRAPVRGKGPVRKPRPNTREGCKAMILVKLEKSGNWMVTKFIKEHNHPLVLSTRECRHTTDEKDKKIQELTAELRRTKRLCTSYREQLQAFIKDVEEHGDQLSTKVQTAVNNVRLIESDDIEEYSDHR
ncbi:hypothetical protein GIB67_019397 [Kingdonia uniflora]|uniref:FAR1 domain-containing protein n=1 Tax=Kingdonia uniflora TaxID=39325 RepID=A0A7J7MBA0_9MAGN|nr:hypothetical protein GIB67_019397 [Kingdonia uniflora]